MTTLLYGSIIQIRSTESIYENKLFYVERLEDDELVLKSNDGNILVLPVEDGSLGDSITEIALIYKPLYGYCVQNKLYKSQWLEIEFEDQTLKGQIIKADNTIEVMLTTDETVYIPVDRGLPKGIKIKKIFRPRENETEEVEEDEVEESPNNGLPLGFIEEDEDIVIQYFYSIEQQTTDLLEHEMMYVSEQDNTPKLKNKMFKLIQRYKELRNKYTDFTNGIYIKKIPSDQLIANAKALTSRLYIPVSKDIIVNNYDDQMNKDIGEYFRRVETENPNKGPFEAEISKLIEKLNKETKFDVKYKTMEEVTRNQYFKTNHGSRRYTFTPHHIQDVYLYEMPNLIYNSLDGRSRYYTRVDSPFLVNSLMMQPANYIHYSKVYDIGSSILNKLNLSRNKYFSDFYKGKQVVVHKKPKNLAYYNKYVYYDNHAPSYDTYLKNIIPGFKSFIDTSIDNDIIQPFYNFNQFINELSVTNIRELKNDEYIVAGAYMKTFIRELLVKYRTEELKEKTQYKFVNNPVVDKMSITYKGLMPKDLLTTYFSSSELFKIGMIDNFQYYKGSFVKEQIKLDITDAEISEILEEIKTKVQEPVEDTIAKIYKTEEERIQDRLPIVLKQVDKRSGIEHIHKQIIELGMDITIDELATLTKHLIQNGFKVQKGKKAELTGIIKTLILEIKVNDGDKAYVEETKKTYTWSGKWKDLATDPTCMIKRKLLKGECGSLEKEVEYNERIARLVFDIEQDRRRENEINAGKIDSDISRLEESLVSISRKNMKMDLKYNEEKRIYGVLERYKEKIEAPLSPYSKLKDKILSESDLNLKYKAVQIFIQKYTKRGQDNNWYYCIETDVKLIPTFFSKLADAYLRTHNYENVMEEICLKQGTKSDNGDMWVDKHSGYIIKEINFEEDEFGREEVMVEKPKMLFDDSVVEELQLQREINQNLKSLLFHLGVYAENVDLYPLIYKSYMAYIEKKTKESFFKQARLLCVMAHALVYVQTNDVKFNKPYPNCKFSFEGYPMTDPSNLNGVNYVACVVSKLAKTAPWNIFAKYTAEQIKPGILEALSLYVVPMIEIKEQLAKKRIVVERVERQVQTDWKNFSPRLGQFTPITYEVSKLYTKYEHLDRAYYYSYVIQNLIHRHVKDQEFLLKDKQSNPYLVNSCCRENNHVYKYFVEHAGIKDVIKTIREINMRLFEFHYYLIGTRVYFNENTKTPITEPTDAFDENTIYMKIIQWAQIRPEIFEQFGLPLPVINKLEHFEKKISRLKEHMPITQETFVQMLQQATTLIPDTKTEEEVIPEPSEIVDQLKSEGLKDMLFGKIEEKLADLMTDKKVKRMVLFNRTCRSNKLNLLITDRIEHFAHMNQILYNKIRSLLYTFPEMIYREKTALDDVVRKYWQLSEIHEKDVEDSVKAYYAGIILLNHDDKMKRELSEVSLEEYKNLMKCKDQLPDQESLNLLYHYIFVSIIHDYTQIKSRNIENYLKAVVKIFENEDRALNYDTTSVEYKVKLSKKSETQIKTDYLKNLSLEERRSENILKEHRLDKWGVGLQKSMFKYDKNTYFTDKQSAQEVINGLKESPEVLDEEEVINPEEGYDIDEKAEDDDDAEYEQED